LLIKTVLNGNLSLIDSNIFDSEDKDVVYLIKNTVYNITITLIDGSQTKYLGYYTPTAAVNVQLLIGALEYKLPTDLPFGYTFSTQGTSTMVFTWHDATKLGEQFTLTVRDENNNIERQMITSIDSSSVSWTVSDPTKKYTVSLTTPTETIMNKVWVPNFLSDNYMKPTGLSTEWSNRIFMGILLVIVFIPGIRDVAVMSIGVSGFATFFWLFGFLSINPVFIALSWLITVLKLVKKRNY
jgi:hypothetical protein